MIFRVFCCAAARSGKRKLAPTPAASAPVPVTFTKSRRVKPRLVFVFFIVSLLLGLTPMFGSEIEELHLDDDVVRVLDLRRPRLRRRNDALVGGRDLQVLLRHVVVEATHVAADVLSVVDRVLEDERFVTDERLELDGLEVEAGVGEELLLRKQGREQAGRRTRPARV